MATHSLWKIVRKYARQLGLKFTPHDLRRTFAWQSRKGGAELDQIQESLGHAALRTTQLYVGANQDLVDAPADHLGF